MKSYAAYFEDEIREHSSSGGLFSVIASYYDVVYGVAMTEDCHGAEFRRMTDDISPLRGSKYLEARIGDIFHQVKKDLGEGKTVLFSGTGCQVNGLRRFLQKDYTNLLTIDVICHGVPSPKLWNEYVGYQEVQYGKKLESVNFRCKDYGWKEFGMRENQIVISKDKDPFLQMFLRDFCLRPSCYECHAKSIKLSDISLGDFWGIEHVAPEMNDGKGVSLVITRTGKGQQVLEHIKQQIRWKEVSYEESILFNTAEYRSSARPEARNVFFHDLSHIPFSEMIKKYASPIVPPVSIRVKRAIKRIRSKWGGGKTTY